MNAIEEIRDLAPRLSPRRFAARVDYWRRGGLPAGGLSERVASSRGHKLPAFDPTDQRLNEAETQYKEAIDGFVAAMSEGDHKGALRHLRAAETLERIWLVPIAKLDAEQLKALNSMVSDAAVCACSNTKERWERMKRRTPWRIKSSFGPCCYSEWAAAGRPEKASWLKLHRPLEAEAS